jgi:uncharacterized protein (TIGR00369 family)
MKKVPTSPGCFVCGKDNPIGLKLESLYKEGKVEATFVPEREHIGYENIIHGGIITSILDEVMVWVPWTKTGHYYFTGEIIVRFSKPLPQGTEVKATARLLKEGKRICETEAELKDNAGNVYATAKGKYIRMKEDLNRRMKSVMKGN